MNELVSIVIPTYGGGEYLDRAIKSALGQSYAEVEVIVVDDNGLGTENQRRNEQTIVNYSSDKRLKYICHEYNMNGSAARNTGAKNAQGEYIALFDDDDEFFPHKIERQMKVLEEHPDCGMTFCSAERIHNGKVVFVDHAQKSDNYLYDYLMHNVHIQTSSMLIRKDVWEQTGGFDESFSRHQDWEFIARLAAITKFYPDDIVGYKYHIVMRNRPQDPEKMKTLRLHYLEKMESTIQLLPNEKQREVFLKNRMDITFEFLKAKRFSAFWREYREIAPGLYGIVFMVNRIGTIIKRGRLKMV